MYNMYKILSLKKENHLSQFYRYLTQINLHRNSSAVLSLKVCCVIIVSISTLSINFWQNVEASVYGMQTNTCRKHVLSDFMSEALYEVV